MGKIKNNPNMVFDQTKRRWVRKDKGKPMKKDSQLSTIIAASHNDIPHIVETVDTFKGKRLCSVNVVSNFFDVDDVPGANVTPPEFEEDGESGLGATYAFMENSIIEVVDENKFAKNILGVSQDIPPLALDEMRNAGLFDSENWVDQISECTYYGDSYMGTNNIGVTVGEVMEIYSTHHYGCSLEELNKEYSRMKNEIDDEVDSLVAQSNAFFSTPKPHTYAKDNNFSMSQYVFDGKVDMYTNENSSYVDDIPGLSDADRESVKNYVSRPYAMSVGSIDVDSKEFSFSNMTHNVMRKVINKRLWEERANG